MEPVGRLRLQEQPVLPDHRGVHSADHPRERSSGVVRAAQRRDLLGRRGPRHGRRPSEGGHEARGRRGHAGGYPSPRLLPQARHAAGVGERVSRSPRAHRVGEGADDPGGFLTAQGVMAGEGERRIPRFSSPAEIKERLAAVSYLADEAVAMTVYLADRLEKPILCEGPAGVGKTALGKGIAAITGHKLTRLQCYEGLDEAKALYEWNYKKQLLRIQADSDQRDWHKVEQDIFTEDFLLARPLLAAIRSPDPVVLLIDLVDQQHHGVGRPNGGKQRAREQEVLREDILLDLVPVPLIGVRLDAEQLLLVVPLVERLRLVEPFVALKARQPVPGDRRDCLSERRLPDAGRPLAQDGLLQPVGEVHGHSDGLVGQIAHGREALLDLRRGREARYSPLPLPGHHALSRQKSTGVVGAFPDAMSAGRSGDAFSHTSSMARLGE